MTQNALNRISPAKYLFKSIKKPENFKEGESEKKSQEVPAIMKENEQMAILQITPKIQREKPTVAHFVAK